METVTPDEIAPRPVGGGELPLSFGQERLWFLDQLEQGGSAAYHVFIVERLRGPLDTAALEHALTEIVARHEILRTRYPSRDGRPAQVIDQSAPPLEFLDLTERTEAEREAEAARIVAERAERPFDLARGPVLRMSLVRLSELEHVLCLVVHHIAVDGWSIGVLFGELTSLYEAFVNGTPAQLPALPIQYGDFALWQRERVGDLMTEQLGYWQRRLADPPVLELPTDRPRPRVKTAGGGSVTLSMPASLNQRIDQFARKRRCTRFMVMLATYQALLARYSGQHDICVGTPVAGRARPELEPLIGFFLNTLVLRSDLSGDPVFGEILNRVRATALRAYANDGLPFDRLVNELKVPRDLSRTPLFQAQLVLHNFGAGRPALADVTVEAFDPGVRPAKLDLSLEVGQDTVTLVYSTDLFDHATAERMAESFVGLLDFVVGRPEARLSELPLLGTAERELVVNTWNAAPRRSPRVATVTGLLEETVSRAPADPAVTFGAESLTYAELNRRANRLARYLRRLGVRTESRVGICLEQSLDLAVAVVAVLKAGGAYVPLDPDQPRTRLDHMLADSGAEVLVTTSAAPDLTAGTVVCLDEDAVAITSESDDDPAPLAVPDNLAYVIYTSGSTGKPKGVGIQHRELLNYLTDVHDRFEIVDGARFGLLQSLFFDFGVTVFYLSLMTGGHLHLIPSRISGSELARYLERAGIDYVKMTPSHLGALAADVEPRRLLPRRMLILGGEGSSSEWTSELAGLSACKIVNHYGPTEATVGVTTFEVGGTVRGPITPIGRPLAHARAYVLDQRLQPVPIGVAGDLYLGGERLARGYLDRPALTAGAFVPDPFGAPGGRMYRTGDLARWLSDGSLEFLGRRDLQVKIRGYRVELGEIDEALRTCPGIAHGVVDARGARGSLELVAYLVSDGPRPGLGELRRELLARLPEYMVPTRYMWLDRLPLKSHGKVDRAALPEPQTDQQDRDAPFEPPAGPVEEAIARVWAEVLGLSQVGAEDDFFDLGGHSLLAIQVVARLGRALPPGTRQVSVLDLFQSPTVRDLAVLALSTDTGPRKLLYRLTPPRTPSLTLVCVPYGGGSAIIYQPLADALPQDCALLSVSIPGHDIGVAEDPWPLGKIADGCVAEILDGVAGPLVLYGHCGLGAMLTVEIARQLEAAGRPVDAVYLGGVFPFARLRTGTARLSLWLEGLRSDQMWANDLRAAGLDVDEIDRDQLKLIIHNRRQTTRDAEEFFTRLFAEQVERLRAPIISVVGERDPSTEFYQERHREWHRLSDTTGVVVVDEAGHFFLKHRAVELADIVTGTHRAIETGHTGPVERREDSTWWLHEVSLAAQHETVMSSGPLPSMRRFAAVAAGQLVSIIGSTLTEFAIPIWIYLRGHSLAQFALLQILAIVPGLLVAPLAGAIVDRSNRRTVMMAGSCAALATQLCTGLLLWTGDLRQWELYPLLMCLSIALTFQRLAYVSAIPQLVPKRFLGHANGVVQTSTGVAQFIAPLGAVALMSLTGLGGVVALDVGSYVFAIVVLACVAFPATQARVRRESLAAEIAAGFRLSMGQRGLRAMVLFFLLLNVVLSPIFLLMSPLVLRFGSISDVGGVAVAGGAGAALGGLVMTVWGGPGRRRMFGMLLATVGMAGFCLVIGAHRSLVLVGAGFFGASFALSLVNGIYSTIVQVKVPQRFHGRVFALNQMVAWSSIPVGIGVIAPLAEHLFEPLLAPGGGLSGTVGAVIGVGPGRGIAFLYVLCALSMAAIAVGALRTRVLSRFDDEVPDAIPDDVIGLQSLSGRSYPQPTKKEDVRVD